MLSEYSMQVVVIGYVWPEPKSSAAGQNMCNLLNALCDKGWNVHFLSAASHSIHAVDLAECGISVHDIALNDDSFNALITDIAPEVVIFDRFMTEEQFGSRVSDACPNALKILNTEDLHALRDARYQQIKSDSDELFLHTDLFYREIASLLRTDLVLLTSVAEQQFLEQHFALTKPLLHVYPLHSGYIAETSTPNFEQRQHVVFIGNFRHAPNWDCVLRIKQLWPAIRRQIKPAECHIYGAYPPKKATQLTSSQQGFWVKGWCEDASAVLRDARVLFAPIRFGAGVKGKFLDAFQTQTPSVTTTVGIEGIAEPSEWPGVVAESDDELINAVVALYREPAMWQHAQDKTRAFTVDEEALTAQNKTLIARIESLCANLPAHRSDNFMGALLQHHSVNASRYMTQWIAAKNTLKDLRQDTENSDNR